MKEDEHNAKAELLRETESLRSSVSKLALANKSNTQYFEFKSHTMLRNFIENASDGIIIVDLENLKILTGNIQFCQMVGYDAQQIKGLHPEDIHPKEYMPYLKEDVIRQVTRRCVINTDIPILRKDGSVFYADTNSIPVIIDGKCCSCTFFRDVTERKKAIDALKQSEETFRLAMEATNDALWDWNIVTNEVYRNPRHATMLGYQPHELTASQDEWSERIHSDDKALVEKVIDDTIKNKTRGNFELEYRLRKKSGDYVWVLGRGKVVSYSDDGSPLRMIGTNIDITERKKMEEELFNERNKLASIMKFMESAVTIFDLDYTVLYLNDYAMKFNAVHVGEKCYRTFTGQDRICDDCLVEQAYKDGRSHTSERIMALPSGEKIYWENTASPIKDAAGRIISCLEIGKDITERKKAQEAIFESEEKYRTLVESAGEGISIIDANGVFLFMNGMFLKYLVYKSPQDGIGKTLWDIFPKEIADSRMEAIRNVIKTGLGITRIESAAMPGKQGWFNATIEPIKNANGERTSALVIARDITEIKLAQERLDKYRQEMAHAERLASLGTLSASAAHELTQPLTVIRLLIENAIVELKTATSPDSVIQKLNKCISQVSNITAVVDRFRNFARKSSGTFIGEVDLKAIAEINASLFNESAKRAKVTISLEGMETLPKILANTKDIEQLFFLLVNNAIQAADQKKEHRVVIRGALKNGHIELCFRDNCGGIAPENIDRIFEPFFTTKPANIGTGLGLCIAQDIVSRAAGKIRVESKFGEGSTFIVTLPVEHK
jgi:PAS domain S-box-containing protein